MTRKFTFYFRFLLKHGIRLWLHLNIAEAGYGLCQRRDSGKAFRVPISASGLSHLQKEWSKSPPQECATESYKGQDFSLTQAPHMTPQPISFWEMKVLRVKG